MIRDNKNNFITIRLSNQEKEQLNLLKTQIDATRSQVIRLAIDKLINDAKLINKSFSTN